MNIKISGASALAVGAFAATLAIVAPAQAASPERITLAQADKPAGEGKVNSIDVAGRKINMTHGPVAALKWPGMTMDFGVAPGVDMNAFKPGEKIGFTLAPGAGGMYMIDSVKPAN
jgi:Cu(I)/Ag(I) efflux system periplasmic protein CusF